MDSKRVIVGLSGGVDSAVSAWLLKQQGYEVQGLFMKNWEQEDYTVPCTSARDLADVRAVCEKLGIVVHTANFSEEYWNDVFTHFLEEHQACRTPNPDILCNKLIKFKAFLEYAKQLGADTIATGHYACNRVVNTQHQLQVAADFDKDQTYFLYTLNQSQLAQVRFPLHNLLKSQVRQLALEIGLPNHAKKDSVGVCFIGERRFKSFLARYLQPNPGPIKTTDDRIIGQHDGLMYYTIGQRRGLQIGGQADYQMGPWYVVAKEADTNVLRVVQGAQHPALYASALHCSEVNWIVGFPTKFPLHCVAKTRYRQVSEACTVLPLESSMYKVQFQEPQRAMTPGQSVVFYEQGICLGGGIIQHVYT